MNWNFIGYWNFDQILMDSVNWLLNPKMHENMNFLYANTKWYDCFYIFDRIDHMQHIKRFFCIFYRLLENNKKYSTNLKRYCQTHPQTQNKIQTKPKDRFVFTQ